ncbi:MAG TPA: two-component regulator propeller domain-containing protein [Rhodanobacteraceae bacterium]|nr:two-component regulator propeller domain-containing protein [Rhodanobacteraceae bacterium]
MRQLLRIGLITVVGCTVTATPWAAVSAVSPPVTATAAALSTPQFRRYGVADGLPSSAAYTVMQDRQGYLWIGTADGLARFDGAHFEVFRHDPRDPASLPSNDVAAVLVDRSGQLWVGGGDNGLNLYDPLSGGFRHWLHHDANADSLSANDVWALAQTADGAIWVGTYAGGLERLRGDRRGFDHYGHDPKDPASLASDIVLSLRAEADGRLWVGTAAGLDLRTPDGRFHHVRFAGLERPPRVWRVDGEGTHRRAATSAGLYRIGADRVATPMRGANALPGQAFASLREPDASLWVAAQGGVDYRDASGRWARFTSEPLLSGGLPGALVMAVNRDREGGLWFALRDGGIAYLTPQWRAFTVFRHVPEDTHSLAASRVLALAPAADGGLWVGGPAGMVEHLDPATGAVRHLGATIGLGPRSVVALAEDARGRLWIGAQSGLRLWADGRARDLGGDALTAGVRYLAPLADGGMAAATPGDGVWRFAPDTLAMTALTSALGTATGRATHQLDVVNGVLWRASSAGFERLDGDRFVFVPGVPRGRINAFAATAHGFWLAYADRLLHVVRDTAGAARVTDHVGSARGWPAVEIEALHVDARGRVWAASVRGLLRYDPGSRTLHLLDVRDGLPSPEFTAAALVRRGDGTVYGGTLGGVLGFHPQQSLPPLPAPQPVLERASTLRNGRVVPVRLQRGTLALGWRERDLTLQLRALSYVDPANTRYRMRLAGFDPGWVELDADGRRDLAGLPPGDYRLEAEAAAPGGPWGALAPLTIRVAAPPWAVPQAYVLYVLAGGLLVWALIGVWRRRLEQRHRMHLAEQQRRLAEDASAAKTRFLATFGHEVRTPMTGVLGMAELLLRSPLDPRQRSHAEAIQHSGSLLLKLVNEALDLARIEAGRFELEQAPFDPAALLREIATLERPLAARKGLAFELEIADDLPTRVLGDASRLRQVLLNLANNALKFTERGTVRLQLQRVGAAMVFVVSDSGPGIPAANRERLFQRFEQGDGPQRQAGSGLGLAICRELIQLMDGRIELESEPGRGSRFSVAVTLPAVAADATSAPLVPAAVSGTPSLRLLLVEDEPTVAEVLRGLLEVQGHQVAHVTHGLAALAVLAQDPFDALLLDLDLPGVDGFELARMLRARETGSGRRLPIVAITARSGGDEAALSAAAGMDGFLRKPVTGAQLAVALAACTEGSPAATGTIPR